MDELCVALARVGGYVQPGAPVVVPVEVVPIRGGLHLLQAICRHLTPHLDVLLPGGKEMILRDVVQPISGLMSLGGSAAYRHLKRPRPRTVGARSVAAVIPPGLGRPAG